ncbi:MAG: DUF2911 domain-containing protein [Lewinellaceae bacterium]|nr:DUF2911 domain-containing protein [Lewinellaceae bacterium]
MTRCRLFFVALFAVLVNVFPALGQLVTPAASPRTQLSQDIGFTTITLQYSRPAVNGRKIFGELQPYGVLWRLGANESSKIRFSRPVKIADREVPAGTYALYAIPGATQWTWILNRDTSLWGERGYRQEADLLRTTVSPEVIPNRVERMELHFEDMNFHGGDLVLDWENTRVRLPIRVDTDAEVEARIKATLAAKPTGTDYYNAARYYLDNGRDLKQARQWMEQRVALEGEQFGILRYKALLEYQLGDTLQARQTMLRSLELAQQAGNEHYVRMNQRSLQDWTWQPAGLAGAEIIRRSIAYHDPGNQWAQGKFQLALYESRPGGTGRFTELYLDNGQGRFELRQQRETNFFLRIVSADTCQSWLNGRNDLSPAEQQRQRMDCAGTQFFRNYYAYLWGLPMKLTDSGTQIDPQAKRRNFFGEDLLEVRVTYSPEVGKDVWYFYFNPQTFALRGYRFYHDEAKNDGEYILLQGELSNQGLKIPARRQWYTHQGREFLGEDVLLENWLGWPKNH